MFRKHYSHHKKISKSIHSNIQYLTEQFGNSSDLSVRNIILSNQGKAALIHLQGIVDDQSLHDNVLHPILAYSCEQKSIQNWSVEIAQIISVSKVNIIDERPVLVDGLLSGDTVILIEGHPEAILAGTRKIQSRSITEPTTQTVVKGPKDGFTENLGTNISLIRARIQNNNLRIEQTKAGKVTKTDIGILYMEGIAKEEIVKEVKERISKIDMDSILDTNYVEEALKDNRKTIFPLFQNSERPDVVSANLLEGKIAIIIQGTPFALILPSVFIQFFHSPEDYYANYLVSSFLRLIRFGSFYVNMYASAIYLALITHHHGLIPTTLMVTLMAQREQVPFPAIVELLVMELAFEVLREAGIRMPRAIGPAVSIVGALILGQAAVEAGFVSAAIVIIVATTAISSFTLPNPNIVNAARGLRFILIFAAAFIGFYGIILFSLCIILHLCSLKSVGVPYLTPLSPVRVSGLKDSLVRIGTSSK
ncbi:spore germination protein [Cytobacillus firmus]|uniref:Spore germination protein n=1 Tax=Cytobacillus firmus TaxID=1399 RepID=A0AA46SJ31_CYTFI|nr:spore germination protein [Cytobacillus firmus]MBY6052786.1 spore germination protein [Cytobacillus firmus]UYG95180.1 spore germination protein [Cytobacillus firmus]